MQRTWSSWPCGWVLLVGMLFGCAEERSFIDMEGRWRFTFHVSGASAAAGSPLVEELQLSIDGSEITLTPVVDGQAQVDAVRAGSISGTPDEFTIEVRWPPVNEIAPDCQVEDSGRTLHGQHLDTLSGTYRQTLSLSGTACPEAGPAKTVQQGTFGAVRSDG